jgi:hypothetical protein
MLADGLTTVIVNDETDVSGKVKESFKKEFAGAKSVKWNDLGDYQMAKTCNALTAVLISYVIFPSLFFCHG